MKGLIIRSPWIDLILDGSKTWEMRSRPTSIRGRIALIKAGSGLIFGMANLTDCLPTLKLDIMQSTHTFHRIPDERMAAAIDNKWTTPWVLKDVVKFGTPRPYVHPSGAVVWVELPDEMVESVDKIGISTKAIKVGKFKKALQLSTSPSKADPLKTLATSVDIPLSGGNIRNGHFYLRRAVHLLPHDCIGGSSKAQAAKNIHVNFDPGTTVETDIAGDKMILRSRSQVRDFFERTGAKEGDYLRLSRIAEYSYVVALRRAD